MDIQQELELLRQANAKLRAEIDGASSEAPIRGRQSASPKRWEAVIYNSEGIIQAVADKKGRLNELSKSFDRSQEADQWCYNKLARGPSDWYAEVHLTGTHVSTRIDRDEAIDRIFGSHKPNTVCHSKSGKFGSLGFGMKVKNTRVEFSRG